MNKAIDIYFVCYGGGHVAIIDALAEYLKCNINNITFKILALTMAHPIIARKYPACLASLNDYRHLFSNSELVKIERYGRCLLQANHSDSSLIDEGESVMYLGLSMMDLVSRIGEVKAFERYNNLKRAAFLPITIMERILQHESPRVVCSTTAPRFEKATLLSAMRLNIKAYEIIDLFGENYKPTANNVIVLNKSVKHNMQKKHGFAKNYYALGQPAVERTSKLVQDISIDSLKSMILTKEAQERINVVFFSQPLVFSCLELKKLFQDKMLSFFSEIARCRMVNLFIRYHPNELLEDHVYLNELGRKICDISSLMSLEETLALSDIVVTPFSTVALEAACCNKTVLTFHHNLEGAYPIESFRQDPFLFAEGFDNLLDNLRRVISVGKTKKSNLTSTIMPFNSCQTITNKLLGGL